MNVRSTSTKSITGLIALLAFLVASVSAQDTDPAACNDLPAYHVLDFWVGEWDVYVGDQKVGFNRIEKTLDGCAIFEHWVGASGGEGKSLFFVSDSGTWKQVWVTQWAIRPGGVKEKNRIDIPSGDGVRFQGQLQHAEIGEWLDRTTLIPLANGEVRQLIEESIDKGETWETGFDAIYRRVASE